MPTLDYSVDALNAKNSFYRAKTMVYVEGDDDVLFWHEVISKFTDVQFEIEQVGGSGEIDKYIDQVESGHLHAIVARDSDLLPLIGKVSTNPRVLYTRGYSIENTLFTDEALLQLSRSWCKSNKITITECQTWLGNLATIFRPLLHLDVANTISNVGSQTIGDNCTRFMTSQSSAVPCLTKVTSYTSSIQPHFSKKSLTNADALIGSNLNQIVLYIRGHFLASAVIKFLVNKAKEYGKKVTISTDSLYSAALMHFAGVFGPEHPHFTHYSTSIAAVMLVL